MSSTISVPKQSNSVERVRAEMRRQLTREERQHCRGITLIGMTGTMYEELFGIETMEGLIIAELYGRMAIPSDDSENAYLFSARRGLVARYNARYTQKSLESELAYQRGEWPVLPKTKQELHVEYLEMENPAQGGAEIEELSQSVATEYVEWWTELQQQETGKTV
ncbi:hypothetical protein Slin15195_G000610 [Septoria linicola]|uniref:Uncharacterized protein n=1 Tax=Septoria linicola TaxID=215465 RepID=A0A9Q9EEQ7_9PEZI|nr:hypothetical protein Slin15195_G000610 [Septoria linicola]